jgi:GT2 family glycosyltransferase
MPPGNLSVVVVTYQSREQVSRSLPALVAELDDADELIVVDNGSTDGTPDAVADQFPDARLICNRENLGFAAAANAGASAASGEVLVFLNPDAAPAPGFRDAIRRPLADGRGWDAWMGLVTCQGGAEVNTRGGVVHFSGIAWAGGLGEPAAGFPTEPSEVAFASGACLAVPRKTWERSGGFSRDFFMYAEDVDLSLRIRLAGGHVGIEPAARVDHEYEFAKGGAKWRYLERNRWATILRVYPGGLLALLAPALLLTELALVPISIAGGWPGQKARAAADVLRALPRLLRERRAIQRTRQVSAAEFARWLTPDLSSPNLGRAGRWAPLRLGLRAYWRLVLALLPRARR